MSKTKQDIPHVICWQIVLTFWVKQDGSPFLTLFKSDTGELISQLLDHPLIIARWGEGGAYLIFVIFFTQAKFLENKIYTEKRQFFALNL